jgi:hypothetical protein
MQIMQIFYCPTQRNCQHTEIAQTHIQSKESSIGAGYLATVIAEDFPKHSNDEDVLQHDKIFKNSS